MSRSVMTAQVLLLCALAACGSPGHGGQASGSGAAATPRTPAASSPAASPPASPVPAPPSGDAGGGPAGCASAKLTITVDTRQGGGAAGSVYDPIDFTNTGNTPCTLFGYPGVSLVARPGGRELGAPATRDGGVPAALVTLRAGGHAHAVLRVVDAGNYSAADCRPVTAQWLRVYPPGETAPGYAAFTTRACSARLPAKAGSQLSVYPVRGGKGRMGQAP